MLVTGISGRSFAVLRNAGGVVQSPEHLPKRSKSEIPPVKYCACFTWIYYYYDMTCPTLHWRPHDEPRTFLYTG